jgi:hypothetical protein
MMLHYFIVEMLLVELGWNEFNWNIHLKASVFMNRRYQDLPATVENAVFALLWRSTVGERRFQRKGPRSHFSETNSRLMRMLFFPFETE